MSRLPPLLPTPPASLKLRGPDAVESRAPKRSPVEPTSGSRCRYVSPYSSASRLREENPPSSGKCREGRPAASSPNRSEPPPPPPPPSKVRLQARSPPYTQRLAELQRAKRPRRGEVDAAEAAVDDREEGEMAGSSSRDESFVAKRPSHSHYNCKHPEASLAAVEERLDPAIRGDGQKLDNEKMEGKNQNDRKAPSRSACRKKIKRKIRAEAKNEMRELKLRGPDAVEPKRCPVELPRPTSGSQRRYVPLYSSSRPREANPPSSSRSRAGRSLPSGRSRSEPLPSTVCQLRERTPPLISPPLAELQHAKRLHREAAPNGPYRGEVDAAEQRGVDLAAVDGREGVEMAWSSWEDESFVAKRPSHSNYNCQHPETSSATVERLDPAIRGDRQKLDNEKMEGKNQNDCKTLSRSARRKKIERKFRAATKKELIEMKKEKLLQKVKKLQACVWFLEKEGAGRPEIMEIRSLLESAEQQYAENEAQSAKEGLSASLEGLNKNKHEEMVGDKILVNLLKAVSKQNELAEEANCLKSELQVVRQDRDYQLAQVQSLMSDIGKQKEVTRRCGVELENAMRRVSALEEGCLLQRETIRTLQIQLASANEKLTVPSPTEDCC